MPEVGRQAPNKQHTQSVVFEKDADWTEASSRKWCEDHDYYTDGFDETDTQYRWRQYDPDADKFNYRNQEIEKDSISLVLGIPKGKQNMATPIRCFEGKAEPHEPFWKFTNEGESGMPELELYGVISEYSWFEDDITPKKFKDDLYAYGKGGPVLLKVNSPGGDVIAASVIRAIMSDYPGEITARVDGMAASAAVVVTMAAKTVQIMDTAYMMIHDPYVVALFCILNIEMLGKLRDDLKAIKDGIVTTYSAKTGLSEDKLSRMMADETWMSARQAVEFGFANEIIEGGQKKAGAQDQVTIVNCLRNYQHVPPALMQAFTQVTDPLTAEPAAPAPALNSMLTADNEREAQTLRTRVRQILEKEN